MKVTAAALVLLGVLAIAPGYVSAQGRYEGSTEARRIFEKGQAIEQKATDVKARRPDDAEDLFEEALEIYDEALEADADFIEAYVRIAYVFYALGDNRAAVGRLEPAVKRWPDDARLQRVYGTVLFDLDGRRAEAITNLEAAAKANRDQFDVHFLLGKHYYEVKDYNKAARALRNYLRLKPDDAQIHGTLGNIYLKTNKLEPALAEFRLVLQLSPDNLSAQINIGNIRFKQRKYPVAIELFEKVLETAPDQKNVHFNLASAYFQTRDFEKSRANYQSFLDHRPGHATGHYMKALCLLRLDREAEARETLNKVLDLKPTYARAYWHVGLLDMKSGELERARDQFELGHLHNDTDPWILSSLGDALRRLGIPGEAIERHKTAIELNARVPEFHVGLGRDHFVLGELDEAVGAFEAAQKLAPRREGLRRVYSIGLLHRARARVAAGELDRAELDADSTLQLGTHVAEAHLIYSAVALSRDDEEAAQRNIKAAREAAEAVSCKIDCPMPYVQRAEARLALRKGDHKAALEALAPLVSNGRAPDLGVATDLGRANAGLGKWTDALQWFIVAKDLGLAPDRAEKNIALACIQVSQELGEKGEWKDAVSVLNQAEKYRKRLSPAEQVALDLSFSNVYAEINSFGKSQRILTRATRALRKLDKTERDRLPGKDELALGLRKAYILLRLGRNDQAVKAAERLPRSGKRGGDVNRLLASAYAASAVVQFRKGRTKQARDHLGKAARLARQNDIIQHNLAVIDYREGKRGKAGDIFKKMSRGGAVEALYNYAIYLDDVKNDDRGSYDLYKRVAARGGAKAADAKRIADAKRRVFGFK